MSTDAEQILDDAIEAAGQPKSVSTPAATVTAHSIPDRLALLKAAGAQEQARSPRMIRFDKLIPPGAP